MPDVIFLNLVTKGRGDNVMMVRAVVKEHLPFEVQIIAPLWLEKLGKFLHNLGRSYSYILSFCLDSLKMLEVLYKCSKIRSETSFQVYLLNTVQYGRQAS
jgi:hypothetical protein